MYAKSEVPSCDSVDASIEEFSKCIGNTTNVPDVSNTIHPIPPASPRHTALPILPPHILSLCTASRLAALLAAISSNAVSKCTALSTRVGNTALVPVPSVFHRSGTVSLKAASAALKTRCLRSEPEKCSVRVARVYVSIVSSTDSPRRYCVRISAAERSEAR